MQQIRYFFNNNKKNFRSVRRGVCAKKITFGRPTEMGVQGEGMCGCSNKLINCGRSIKDHPEIIYLLVPTPLSSPSVGPQKVNLI
jgi:hypothetical protein